MSGNDMYKASLKKDSYPINIFYLKEGIHSVQSGHKDFRIHLDARTYIVILCNMGCIVSQ